MLSGAVYFLLLAIGVWLVNRFVSSKGQTLVLWAATIAFLGVIAYYSLR